VTAPTLTFADVFSGCGGLTWGFSRHPAFKPLLAVDWWTAAEKVFTHNYPGLRFERHDLHDLSAVAAVAEALSGRCDVLLGGPPCQGFSTLGKRRDGDRRSALVDAFLDVANRVKPAVVVMENVRGISSKMRDPGGMTFMEFARRSLADGGKDPGYDVECVLLHALDYGLAQTRQRWFLIGVRQDVSAGGAVLRRILDGLARSRSPKRRVLRDVIADLPQIEAGEGEEVAWVRAGSRRRAVFNHRAMNHSERLVKAFATVPVDGGLLDVPREMLTPHLHRMVDGKYGNGGHIKNIYGRLNWTKPSGTVVAGIDKITCGRFVHPEADRLLTPRECARLQSFSDDFRFFGSLVTQYYLIGNAVPPRFSEILANAISKAIEAKPRRLRQDAAVEWNAA